MEVEGYLDLDGNAFDSTVAKGITLVFFWAHTCNVCMRLNPVAESLSKTFKGQVQFARLNVDDFPEIAQAHDIRFIPMMKIYRDGIQLHRVIGLKTEDELTALLSSVTGTPTPAAAT